MCCQMVAFQKHPTDLSLKLDSVQKITLSSINQKKEKHMKASFIITVLLLCSIGFMMVEGRGYRTTVLSVQYIPVRVLSLGAPTFSRRQVHRSRPAAMGKPAVTNTLGNWWEDGNPDFRPNTLDVAPHGAPLPPVLVPPTPVSAPKDEEAPKEPEPENGKKENDKKDKPKSGAGGDNRHRRT